MKRKKLNVKIQMIIKNYIKKEYKRNTNTILNGDDIINILDKTVK